MAAPSSPSSSCEIVDLAVAATLGDATSRRFFSKGGGSGDDDLSWPEAAAIESTLTSKESLVALCHRHGVPRELEPVCAGKIAACHTPTQGQGGSNPLCIYADALEAGLRFPMPVFYGKLLRHYGLAPSQLAPNAWAYMAAFLRRCEQAGVVEQQVSAFTYFFSLCAHKHKGKDRPLGWHHFHQCAGRPHLFRGGLLTKHGWKSRFLFFQPPEGMPWRCPVAWGKPRRESAGTVELRNAAVEELKKLPCVDLESLLTLYDPPVGALNLLQLPSPTAPTAKLESAAASAQAVALTSLTQLQATLEAGARAPSAGDEGHDSTWRKRRCPGPGLASVTPPMPQSLDISAPPLPQGMGMAPSPCETSFDGAWGGSSSSEISMPRGIWASDALYMYDAMVAIEAEKAQLQDTIQQAAQEITYLQDQLQQANTVNTKFVDYLVAARTENARLKDQHASEIAKLSQEHASEVAKLQEEHYKASTAHAEKVNAERKAEIARLQEKHAAEVAKLNQAHDAAVTCLMEEHEVDVARVKHAPEEVVQDAKRDIVLALFPDLDASLL